MYRLTVIKNMRTKVDRVINITETVQTEVEFPKYTRDSLSYYKHYSEGHCVVINTAGNTFASVFVTYNNNGRYLFDEEISEDEFNRVLAEASELLMPELQQKQKATDWTPAPEDQVNEWGEAIWQRSELQPKQEEKI